jgi:hypothetical protein
MLRGGDVHVTPILFVLLPLVVVLLVLIASINNGTHYTPQAYYRRKRLGAPVAFGVDALGPRLRRRLPGELDASPVVTDSEPGALDPSDPL